MSSRSIYPECVITVEGYVDRVALFCSCHPETRFGRDEGSTLHYSRGVLPLLSRSPSMGEGSGGGEEALIRTAELFIP